jgi:hypothetical protein
MAPLNCRRLAVYATLQYFISLQIVALTNTSHPGLWSVWAFFRALSKRDVWTAGNFQTQTALIRWCPNP